MDEMIAAYQAQLSRAPAAARQGHHGTYLLVDREKHEAVVVALWASAEGAQAAAASQWNQTLGQIMAGFFTDTPERRLYKVALAMPSA